LSKRSVVNQNLYVAVDDNDQRGVTLLKIDLKTGKEERILDEALFGRDISEFVVASDARSIIILSPTPPAALFTVDSSTKLVRQLVAVEGASQLRLTNRGVFFIKRTEISRPSEIQFLDLLTGKVTTPNIQDGRISLE
jgi:hypothetical protein